jgi:glycosyltransferase involved in cell wall biosynthesis
MVIEDGRRVMRPLFLTWDGPDQSYLESLFLPIFARLRGFGIHVHVLQFTWASEPELTATRRVAKELGIPYSSVRTFRALGALGVVGSIVQGAADVDRYVQQHHIDTLFPRSLLPAAMALAVRRRRGIRLVFDADGLMADERVDFAGWDARGAPYRVLREVEAQATRLACSVITRTQSAKAILLDRAGAGTSPEKIHVIPNAKDSAQYAPGTPASRALVRDRYGVPSDAPWLVYVGSLGPQYLPHAMVDLFRAVLRLRPTVRLHLFTFQAELFRQALESRGTGGENVSMGRAEPAEIALALAGADLGLALRARTFSQQAVCPIKVAEYLLCGVPVVTTAVGDLSIQLADSRAAFVAAGPDELEMQRAAGWFIDTICEDRDAVRARCRQVGIETFGLDAGVASYRNALSA